MLANKTIKKSTNAYLITFILFISQIHLMSIVPDEYTGSYLKYEDYVYKPNIKTILFYNSVNSISPPIIQLNKEEKLIFSFDDLDGYPKDYFYEIILCNKDWTPADLISSQYLEGSPENLLNHYEYSACLFSKYINYTLELPNDYVQFSVSGNFLLKVYENGDKNDLIITKRFIIYETKVDVRSRVIRTNNPDEKYTGQELKLLINHENLNIVNPYQNLHVTVLQNFNWHRIQDNLQPSFIRGYEMEFSFTDKNIFRGGSEFRNLDLKSYQYKTLNVHEYILESPIKTILNIDQRMSNKKYEFWQDLNGQKIIQSEISRNHNTETEYMETYFSLLGPPFGKNVYIESSFCEYAFNKNCLMEYNQETRRYEKKITIKQGLHNYLYATLDEETKQISFIETEGERWETENNYFIIVYYKGLSDLHDKIIGYATLNTRNP